MDEELSTRLTGYLDVIEKAVESGSVFVVEQAPAVVQELILYERIYTTIAVAFSLLLLVVGVVAATKVPAAIGRLNAEESVENFLRMMACLIITIFGIGFGCVLPRRLAPAASKLGVLRGWWSWRRPQRSSSSINPDLPVTARPFRRNLYRRPLPKPFTISEKGVGVYRTRDGQEEEVHSGNGYLWKDRNGTPQWYDNGQRSSVHTGPGDLVEYIGPLPKPEPAVDPAPPIPPPDGFQVMPLDYKAQPDDLFLGRHWCRWQEAPWTGKSRDDLNAEFSIMNWEYWIASPIHKPVTAKTLDVGPGYRPLHTGERIQEGDEYYSDCCKAWLPTGSAGCIQYEDDHLRRRRKLPTNPLTEDQIKRLKGIRDLVNNLLKGVA